MKKLAKIFIWISIIFQFWLIFPLIIGVLALDKLDSAKNKDELLVMSILTTLFCSAIAGIFMFCIKEEEINEEYYEQIKKQKQKNENTESISTSSDSELPDTKELTKELEKAKKLYEDKLITEEEYNQMREKILNKFLK